MFILLLFFPLDSKSSCDPTQIQCRSGQCISANLECNGVRDCNDNTDEEGCVTGTLKD